MDAALNLPCCSCGSSIIPCQLKTSGNDAMLPLSSPLRAAASVTMAGTCTSASLLTLLTTFRMYGTCDSSSEPNSNYYVIRGLRFHSFIHSFYAVFTSQEVGSRYTNGNVRTTCTVESPARQSTADNISIEYTQHKNL